MKRIVLATAVAAALAAPVAFSAGPLTLYKERGFLGEALVVEGPVRDLKPQGFDDNVSSIRVDAGYWQFCTEPNFNGSCALLTPGRYAVLDDQLDRRIESVREMEKVGPGKWLPREARVAYLEPAARPALELFTGTGFTGTALGADRDIADLRPTPVGNDAASVVVHEGHWEACTDSGFAGRCEVLVPGTYPDLGRRIESIRRVG